ncbi:MAG TPA: aminotransferase class V-fold PLP-dependent enzyme [Terriglobales bacterium]|nr:aminotransferase class V-fold PLP-dependent enzyme [Terriglobales bacterium]
MAISRRELLAGLGGMAAIRIAPPPGLLGQGQAMSAAGSVSLPTKSDFAMPAGVTYINSAYTHPMPLVAAAALREWADFRSQPQVVSQPKKLINVKVEFAALINAKEAEISYVTSTSAGENLVVNGLGLDYKTDNVVTDALHFEGAILHLQALEQRFGLDLRIVKPRNWRIELGDLERVVDKKTKLIEISLVAMHNGFQHDLKAVCDLAHAHGAYVYADIAQAAGSTPIDVRESDVDFCACSSFKWLMADFGLGFLFVKEALLDRILRRTQYGYFEAKTLESHFLPGDSPNPAVYTWDLERDASGHFEVGTHAIGTAHVLAESLPYIRRIGVENIHAYRQPMLKRLHEEMPRLGFEPLTPPDSTSALVSFAARDYKAIVGRLEKAGVNARVSRSYIRISPSVFNDMKDIDRLLEALS